jgi:auxin efflux carrier family protein
VILICGGGYVLASIGVLDRPSQRSLSNANLYFFTPCLIFVKLAAQLRWNLIRNLWAIPLLVALLISTRIQGLTDVGVGFVVAKIGSRLLKLDRQWEKFVTACTIFQNVHLGRMSSNIRLMRRQLL